LRNQGFCIAGLSVEIAPFFFGATAWLS
jgi:hypothetical protein